LSWSDLVPSWPDDFDLEPSAAPASAPPALAPPALAPPAAAEPVRPLSAPWAEPDEAASPEPPDPVYKWQFEGGSEPSSPGELRPAAFGRAGDEFDDDDRHPASAASRRVGLGAFDPGRRGARALAAVAAVVVLIAAVLAWRSRPRVDPVPPVPASVDAPSLAAGAATGDVPGVKPAAGDEVVIAVGGKVKRPGLVRLPAGSRVADALQAAGGADPGVDVALLNLARKVVDGELILVGVTPPPGAVAAPGPAGAPGGPPGPVNLNTATLADLDTLPGVGPVLAQRILDARGSLGGFKSVTDLRKVDGIGDSRYEQLKDLVTV
jgi:competence protein ComEA